MKPVGGGLLSAVGAALLLLALFPATSSGAYPGANGLIAYEGPGGEIFTISPAGGDPTQLTVNNDQVRDRDPSWSADGRKITFVRGEGQPGGSGVWVMRADGGRQHEVIETRRSDAWPYFSPGGGRIVFVDGNALSTVRTDGTHLRRLVTGTPGDRGNILDPEYSPNGKRIVFAGVPKGRSYPYSIWTIHRDGSHLRRLTRPHGDATDEAPDWRPDGRRIAYLHCTYEDARYGCLGSDQYIYSIRPNGSGKHRVQYASSPPAYSPAGDRIALFFWITDWPHSFPDTIVLCSDIYTIRAGGGDRRAVTHNCDGDPSGFAAWPSWQPIPAP
jgi:Tol biopolymer transport system component